MADGNGNELGHFSPYYFMYLHSFVKYIDIYHHICTHVCVYTYSLMHPVIEIELPENQKFRCVYICTVPSHMTISLHIATLSAYWLDTLRNALVMYDVSYKALCTINNYFFTILKMCLPHLPLYMKRRKNSESIGLEASCSKSKANIVDV